MIFFKIQSLLRKWKHKYNIHFIWVPSHVGYLEQNAADIHAGRAALLNSPHIRMDPHIAVSSGYSGYRYFPQPLTDVVQTTAVRFNVPSPP